MIETLPLPWAIGLVGFILLTMLSALRRDILNKDKKNILFSAIASFLMAACIVFLVWKLV